jgi:hypothetical protein
MGQCKLQSRCHFWKPFVSLADLICDLLPYKFLSVLLSFLFLSLFLSFGLSLCFLSFLHSFKFFLLSLFLSFIHSFLLCVFFSFFSSLIPSAHSLQCGNFLLMENIARNYCHQHLSGSLGGGELQTHMAAIEKEQRKKEADVAEWNSLSSKAKAAVIFGSSATEKKVRLLQLSPKPIPLL